VSDGATTRFGYDGGEIVLETDGANAVLRRYVKGAGADETLVWYEGSGSSNPRWLYADERGSVVAITDGAGSPLATNTYDEYGRPGSGNLGRFQYTGQAYIASLGLYYYKARFYAPSLGKFLQPDPIGYAGGMNLYAYVGGDPVNFTDPSGLFTCERTYTYHGYTDSEGDYVSVAKSDGWSCHGDPWDYGPIGPIGELVSGGGDSGGGDSGEAPQEELPKDDCVHRTPSGRCAYRKDDKGKLQFDPDYGKKACEDYRKMMQSAGELSDYTFGLAGANGARSIIQKGTGLNFLAVPIGIDVIIYSATVTVALLQRSPPPPGCTK